MQEALEFYKTLFEELDPKQFQRQFLKTLLQIQNVERGSLWVKRGKRYVCVEAMGPQSEKIRGLSINQDKPSIVGWVIENKAMTIAEGGKDDRHYKEIEEGLSQKSNLILCFPLTLRDGEVYGAVQIIDTSAEGSRLNLDPDYLQLLQTLVSVGSVALSNALTFRDTHKENVRLKRTLDELRGAPSLIGQSEAFLEVLGTIRDYARTDFPVLITGESGTGKELAAQEIHRLGPRASKPFLVQNCSAIPETLLESELFGYKKGAFTGADHDKVGLFAAADGGAVFLDEIGDMPIKLQARILRVLQNFEVKPLGDTVSKRVDVRVIAATNKNLSKAAAAGEFREDLFYRLNVLPLPLPPLRERRRDIPLLLNYFLKRDARAMGAKPKRFSPEAVTLLTGYYWKGNIREMENLVKYLLTTVDAEVVTPEELPPHLLSGPSSGVPPQVPPPTLAASDGAARGPALSRFAWSDLEREYILSLLEKNTWNVTRASRDAGLKRTTFDARMKKLGIRKA